MKENNNFKLISIFLLVGIFLSLGAINWWTVGNEGAVYGNGGNYWLYASPFTTADDNVNFTTLSINVPTSDLRVGQLLNDYASANHIYYFTGSSVICKDIYGNTISSFNVNGTINDIDFINYESDNDLEILIRYSTNKFTLIEMDANFEFQFIKYFTILNYELSIFKVDFSDGYIAYVENYSNDNIQVGIYDILNDINTIYDIDTSLNYDIASILDINLDAQNDVFIVAYRTSGTVKDCLATFDILNKVASFRANIVVYSSTSHTIRDIRVVNIGSSGSQNVIAFKKYAKPTTAKSTFLFYDLDCGKIIESVEWGTYAYDGFLHIADVNLDGFNDYCFINFENSPFTYECYKNNNDLIWSYTSTTSQFHYTFANYQNNNNFLEIVTPYDIFNITIINETTKEISLTNITNLKQFSITDLNVELYPVILLDKQEYIKDLIITDGSVAYINLASGTPSVCGDGVCSFGESMVNCPTDCLDSAVYTFNIKDVEINPSINAIWKNGTLVRIEYTVDPSDDNIKYQTKASISFNNGVNYTNIDDWGNILEKEKTIVHDTQAIELTENGKIKIEVRVFSRNTSETVYYNFIVRENGLEYGEGLYSEKQTSENIKKDNAIYDAFLLLASLTNVSVLVLYLFVSFVVVGAIGYYIKDKETNKILIMGLMMFIMLLIGTLTGCLPISIIITISIIGIIILSIGFKNSLMGDRG